MNDRSDQFGFYDPPKVDWRHVPEELRDLYSRPGFLIRRCHQIAVSLFIAACEPFGLTPTQFGVLYAVESVPGVTQIEVAKILGLDRSTTGSVVNRLEQSGLLQKSVSKSDRRKFVLHMTANGKEMCKTANVAARDVHETLLAPLKLEEREQLIGYLRTIMQAHGEAVRAPMGFDGM